MELMRHSPPYGMASLKKDYSIKLCNIVYFESNNDFEIILVTTHTADCTRK